MAAPDAVTLDAHRERLVAHRRAFETIYGGVVFPPADTVPELRLLDRWAEITYDCFTDAMNLLERPTPTDPRASEIAVELAGEIGVVARKLHLVSAAHDGISVPPGTDPVALDKSDSSWHRALEPREVIGHRLFQFHERVPTPGIAKVGQTGTTEIEWLAILEYQLNALLTYVMRLQNKVSVETNSAGEKISDSPQPRLHVACRGDGERIHHRNLESLAATFTEDRRRYENHAGTDQRHIAEDDPDREADKAGTDGNFWIDRANPTDTPIEEFR